VRGQLAGRDLIQQRREQMEVVAVQQRDLRLLGSQVTFSEVTDEVQPGEAAADDDDALQRFFPTSASTRSSSPM
jgi:hypothetical protein